MGNKIWYHGSSEAFEKFDPKFIGGGIDQYGVGFYFTELKEVAEGYAGLGYLYSVKLNEENVMIVDKESRCIQNAPSITKKHIRELLESSHNFKEVIWDFGDIGSHEENLDEVLQYAVDTYYSLQEPLNLFNSIANDFFRGDEGQFALKVKELMGTQGIEVRGDGPGSIFVAFDANDIEIIGVPQRKEGIESILESNAKIMEEVRANSPR